MRFLSSCCQHEPSSALVAKICPRCSLSACQEESPICLVVADTAPVQCFGALPPDAWIPLPPGPLGLRWGARGVPRGPPSHPHHDGLAPLGTARLGAAPRSSARFGTARFGTARPGTAPWGSDEGGTARRSSPGRGTAMCSRAHRSGLEADPTPHPAGPSRAGPSRAEPSGAEPSRAAGGNGPASA